ncbi:MAG: DUF4345 domain-containing protein [Acidobacteria bacterium]|nr:DUF4345 domain-containing protein [Acidobacteriota bacterium]
MVQPNPGMAFARAVILLHAVIFLACAALFIGNSAAGAAYVEVAAPTPGARIDFRATYGGFCLATGLFLLAALCRPAWTAPVLAALGLALASLAGVRLLGIGLEGIAATPPAMWVFLSIESVGAAAAWFASRGVH